MFLITLLNDTRFEMKFITYAVIISLFLVVFGRDDFQNYRPIDDEDDEDLNDDVMMNDASGDGHLPGDYEPIPYETKKPNVTDDIVVKETTKIPDIVTIVQKTSDIPVLTPEAELPDLILTTWKPFVEPEKPAELETEKPLLTVAHRHPTPPPPVVIPQSPKHPSKDEPITAQPPESTGLSPGAIAGMIITSVVIVVIVIIVVFCCKQSASRSRTQIQEQRV